ncbi:unnamed protein product, partial [Meganyctiphanes norvegica]
SSGSDVTRGGQSESALLLPSPSLSSRSPPSSATTITSTMGASFVPREGSHAAMCDTSMSNVHVGVVNSDASSIIGPTYGLLGRSSIGDGTEALRDSIHGIAGSGGSVGGSLMYGSLGRTNTGLSCLPPSWGQYSITSPGSATPPEPAPSGGPRFPSYHTSSSSSSANR